MPVEDPDPPSVVEALNRAYRGPGLVGAPTSPYQRKPDVCGRYVRGDRRAPAHVCCTCARERCGECRRGPPREPSGVMLALSHRAPSLLPTTRAWCARPSAGKPEGAQPLGLDKERPNHTNKGLFAKLSDEQETTFHPEITSKARQQYRNSVLPRSAHTAACLRACLMLGAEAVFGVLSRLLVMQGCARLQQDCPNICTRTIPTSAPRLSQHLHRDSPQHRQRRDSSGPRRRRLPRPSHACRLPSARRCTSTIGNTPLGVSSAPRS